MDRMLYISLHTCFIHVASYSASFICDSKALLHCSLFCRISEEEDLHLGTSFSAETNRRDEDADM